ncbi:hypothetical protein QE177_01610 [Arsenophonus sp. aPb]|uniref:hypothetical protein n=1 Tax=Arsenophonus sp. aPb TaxID=3041619 RepID=UPI0024696127|nr:hypothetical protein [Arsenophonus sp. aPb]WGL98631.1 hypothetical protein QE177_01610 [Arsenophonus sp. aPb]
MIEINIDGKSVTLSEQEAFSLCQKIQQELTEPLKNGRVHTFGHSTIHISQKSNPSDSVLTDC